MIVPSKNALITEPVNLFNILSENLHQQDMLVEILEFFLVHIPLCRWNLQRSAAAKTRFFINSQHYLKIYEKNSDMKPIR
jgi:hypothetical protein